MKTQNPLKFVFIFIVFVIFISIWWGQSVQAQQESSPPEIDPVWKVESPTLQIDLQIPDLWVVRVYFNSQQDVANIAARIEPWEVNYQEGYLVVGVTQADYNRLLTEGYQIEIDHETTAFINQPLAYLPMQTSGIPGYPCYRTVEETYTSAENIVAAHPTLANWIDIGNSWEKVTAGGLPGYDLMVLRLTNEAITIEKPKLFIMTAVHAREYATAELNTRFAEYLVANYNSDPDITWLLDYNEIHLLLHSNPDGRKKAETGLYWRKNTNQNFCSPTSNYRGADLNRNFEFQWGCCGGSSSYECDETYRGPSPASEPEVQAIQNYIRSIFPDQRGDNFADPAPDDAMGIFLDIHSYGELVIWPWGFTNTIPPNGSALQTLGRKFAYFNNYEPDQAVGLYPTDGSTDDFAYGDLGLAAYTFELGTSFFQGCSTFENTILPDNLLALIYAAKTSRTPYLTPAGPDALDVSISPDFSTIGDSAILNTTINDIRFSSNNGVEPIHNITAAEYYIDTPPWISSAITYTMSAVDGNFDTSIEDVTAIIDTSGLTNERHIIFVRGQDTTGNWGAISAVFLLPSNYQFLPIIQR